MSLYDCACLSKLLRYSSEVWDKDSVLDCNISIELLYSFILLSFWFISKSNNSLSLIPTSFLTCAICVGNK